MERFVFGAGLDDYNILLPFFPTILSRMQQGSSASSLSLDDLLAREGPCLSYVANNRPFYSIQQLLSIVEAYQSLSGDDSIGVRIGRMMNFSALGLLGQILVSAFSLRDAFSLYDRFWHLSEPAFYFRNEIRHEDVVVNLDDIRSVDEIYRPVMAEMFFSAYARVIGSLVNEDVPIKGMKLSFGRPRHGALYSREFCENVEFDSSENCLIFSREILEYEPIASSQVLNAVFVQRAKRLQSKMAENPGVSRRVARIIEDSMNIPEFGIEDLAGAMAMDVRTLQRKLKEEGVSFKVVADAVRFDGAKALLKSPELEIEQISDLVGFRDLSGFKRAFRRWSGHSPREYRLRYGAPGSAEREKGDRK